MAVRIRKDGRVLCAAMHPAEEGDTYLHDGLHYRLSAQLNDLVTEPMELPEGEGRGGHGKHGEWWWSDEVPGDVVISSSVYSTWMTKETIAIIERLGGEGYSVQIEYWFGAVEEVAWHVNLWEGRAGDVVRPYNQAEDVVFPEGLAGVAKGKSILQSLQKAEALAKGTMDGQLAGMPGGVPT